MSVTRAWQIPSKRFWGRTFRVEASKVSWVLTRKLSIFYKMLTFLLGGIKFVEWIGILPASENVQNLIESSVVDPILDKNATLANVNFHLPQWQEFEKRLGYHFNNRAFLLQALTHSSYSPNRVTQSYERLEFIGDAILDFLITCYIYEHCGVLNPGEVTDLRSALVNNNTFASLVVRCGFHKFLLMINLKLQGHIDKFAEYLATKNHVIDDEVLILLEEKDLNMAEYVDVPKVCKVRS
jgi:endoribonuclease Dicer